MLDQVRMGASRPVSWLRLSFPSFLSECFISEAIGLAPFATKTLGLTPWRAGHMLEYFSPSGVGEYPQFGEAPRRFEGHVL